ncbi:MAG: energy transducer TonB [Candidatus Korobacteraceae bacterium]
MAAEALSPRIVNRTRITLQGHAARLAGTIELLVVIGPNGKPTCISVVRGHPILTSTAIASVKDWKFRPYRTNRKLVHYSGTLVLDAKEFITPD